MANRNFTPFPLLKTDRLVLRQLISGDRDGIFKLRSDQNVNKYLGRLACKSIEGAISFINTINNNIQKNQSVYWAITINNNQNLIGTICLFDFSEDKSKAEIGYELLPDFQGKGIMKEAMFKVLDYAFHTIELITIDAFTHPDNVNSTRLLEKFNFKNQIKASNNLIKFELSAKSFLMLHSHSL